MGFFNLTGVKKGAQLPLEKVIHFRTLELSMKTAVQSCDAEAQWAQNLVISVNSSHAAARGVGLEAAFAQGQEAIDVRDVEKVFSTHLTLDKEQWATLLAFIPKLPDGRALWRDLLRWAGVTT